MFQVPFLSSFTKLLSCTALDDGIDMICCCINAFLYICFALAITAKINFEKSIDCWVPQTYSRAWEEFGERFCFLKNTYWFPDNEHIAHISHDFKEKFRLQYYQWASLYFGIASLAWIIPKFLWKFSQEVTEMPIIYFCTTTKQIREETAENRTAKIKEMADLLRSKVTAHHLPYSMAQIRPNYFLVSTKLFYIFVSFLQFIALAYFIGQKDDILWGWTLARNIYNDVTWKDTGMFPRKVYCDFEVRELAGNNREETIQCLIAVNEFSEKIFLFLWFWLPVSFTISVVGNIYLYIIYNKTLFIRNLLHMVPESTNRSAWFSDFADNYLKKDGLLVLKFVSKQSDTVAQELAFKMFQDYKRWRSDNPMIIPDGSGKSGCNSGKFLV